MHKHKGIVTLRHCIQDYSYGVNIVYLAEITVLDIHFFINAVNAFNPAENRRIL